VCADSAPGFLQAESSVLAYGTMDSNATFANDAAAVEKLRPLAQALHLAPHEVLNAGGEAVPMLLPADCKACGAAGAR
jgi:hypothetical protein